MPDLSSAPPVIRHFAERLAERGTPLQTVSFESSRNQLLRTALTSVTVQILADRGQWFVELAPAGVEDWFDTAAWRCCLEGGPVSVNLDPLDTQVAWIEDYLARSAKLHVSLDCLREARRERAYQRMGLA